MADKGFIKPEKKDFQTVYGNLNESDIFSAEICPSQCTGCMCQCKSTTLKDNMVDWI
ncbi:hypothetical protein JCM16358_08290 [Halanaerocella petrolearia]